MKRDYLEGLGLEKEVVDKIMAEYGKSVGDSKEEISSLKSKIKDYEEKVKDYETKINDLSTKAENNQKIQEELDNLKKSIAEENMKKEQEEKERILTKNIEEVFGDKKFINEYTKEAIIKEVKNQLNDKQNAGKSAKEIFENITKDKDGIFENDNKVTDIPPVNDNIDKKVDTSNEVKLNNSIFSRSYN